MEGVDAVITHSPQGPLYPSGTPIAAAYSRIIATMKEYRVPRLISLTTPTVQKTKMWPFPLILAKVFRAFAPDAVKDIATLAGYLGDGKLRQDEAGFLLYRRCILCDRRINEAGIGEEGPCVRLSYSMQYRSGT
ncbi:hypothetical protein B0H11DRAFT_486242 [Mycena galericulata]|nr:hypothetical protein B0H11DRAFT_486242 [Mycena galericulata]